MQSKVEALLRYHNDIMLGRYESKEMGKMYLSNLEALAMEIEGYEDLVDEAKKMIKMRNHHI